MSRSTIEFNDIGDRELAQIGTTLGIKSKAEIVRNALSLYAYLAQNLNKPERSLGIIAEDNHNSIEKVIAVPGISFRPATPTDSIGKRRSTVRVYADIVEEPEVSQAGVSRAAGDHKS